MFLQFLRARTIRRLVENLPALKVHLKPDRYIVRLLREHGYTIPFHGKMQQFFISLTVHIVGRQE